MTDDTPPRKRIGRRKFVAGVGAGAAAGLAGCGGDGGGDGDGDGTPTATQEPTSTMPESPPTGGRPTLGMATAPETTNPLVYDTSYDWEIIKRVYDFGVTLHPTTYEYKPWTFTEWDVSPGNAGTSSPTVTATMRDDTTFSDGESVTPEDYKFTVEYLKEQEVTGSISASQVSRVEDVKTTEDGVEIFLSEPYNSWFGDVLGQIILPQHIWKNVSDYTQYQPRNEGGPIGSGPMTLEDYSWENWFEFDYRPKEEIPWPRADYVDWIHEEGPFLDGTRLEIFGSASNMEQNLLDGNLTCVFQGVGPSTANTAQNTEGVALDTNPSSGYDHVSFNMRRVPFDDVAFRQFLRKMLDSVWIVEEPYNGIGAQRGSYPSIAAFESWRPPEPWETDEYEGISLPDLTFPGEEGEFTLDESAIQDARDFLENHEEAKHDYSFEEGSQSNTNAPDGLQLHVNGEPLTQAHTNNAGEGGQGPIVFRFQPSGEDLTQNQTGNKFTTALRRVGVPISKSVETINSTSSAVYFQENFDMYSMGWGVTPYLTLYQVLYGEAGIDQEGTAEVPGYNPMAYTGIQDLIEEDVQTMERSERVPLVKQMQAQIWHDAPTAITIYKNLLEPVDDSYSGFYSTVGGLFATPWMNVYQEE
jgi:peptide/nickel transport system substrate-binding protein